MPELWNQAYDVPPYHTLKRAKDNELSDDLREKVTQVHHNKKCAVKKMISYVSITRGIPFKEVTLEHLTEPDVAEAACAYQNDWRKLSAIFQRFLFEQTGRRTRPLENIKYRAYHPTLMEWVEDKGKTIRDTSQYRTVGMQFLDWVTTKCYFDYKLEEFPVALIDRELLLHYRNHLLKMTDRDSKRKVYLKRHMALIVEWVRWLMLQQRVPEFSLERLALPNGKNRERRLPTDEQVERLVRKAEELNRPMTAVILLLMLATGGRPSEIIKLTMDDLDFAARRIRLQSKGGPEREIQLPDDLWKLLMAHIERTYDTIPTDKTRRIFLNQRRRPLQYASLERQLFRLRRDTGIRLDGFMALRHKFATDCLESGVPMRVFQYLMGHEGISEKSRYQHVKREFLGDTIQQAFQKIPWKDELHAKADQQSNS